MQQGIGQRRWHRTLTRAKGEELLRITGGDGVFGVERYHPRLADTLFRGVRPRRRIVTPVAPLAPIAPYSTLPHLGQLGLEYGQGLMATIAIRRFGFFAL